MNRSTFLKTLAASAAVPLAAKATTASAKVESAPRKPLAKPVTLKLGIMGYEGKDEPDAFYRVWKAPCPGGLPVKTTLKVNGHSIHGRTAEDMIHKVALEAAIVIATVEHGDNREAYLARIVELADKIRIGS